MPFSASMVRAAHVVKREGSMVIRARNLAFSVATVGFCFVEKVRSERLAGGNAAKL